MIDVVMAGPPLAMRSHGREPTPMTHGDFDEEYLRRHTDTTGAAATTYIKADLQADPWTTPGGSSAQAESYRGPLAYAS